MSDRFSRKKFREIFLSFINRLHVADFIFCDVNHLNLVVKYQHFGVTRYLNIQGEIIRVGRSSQLYRTGSTEPLANGRRV
jgi:hypothetical protein